MSIEGQGAFRLEYVPLANEPIVRTRENIIKYETTTSSVATASEAEVARWEEREAQIQKLIDREAQSHEASMTYLRSQKGRQETTQETERTSYGAHDEVQIVPVTKESYGSAHAVELVAQEDKSWNFESSHLANIQERHRASKPDPSATREIEGTASRLTEISGWTGDLSGSVRVRGQQIPDRLIRQTTVVRPEEVGDEREEAEVMADLDGQLKGMLAYEVTHVLEKEIELNLFDMQGSHMRSKATANERALEDRLIPLIVGDQSMLDTPREIDALMRAESP